MDSDLTYKPEILDISLETAKNRLTTIRRKYEPKVFDFIESQIKELILCRNPSYDEAYVIEHDLVNKHLASASDKYGTWVYYSWKNTLVHLLSEEEFIEVRTNRNRNKITQEEQNRLRTKTVGVAGLSVGRSVALTIATERIASTIYLADFDSIELTNLNRLKVSLLDLGLNKTISAAREISEIDPYIKIECFKDGLKKENFEEFFNSQNGKLDIFIEECDDLAIKVASRIKAKELGIPVIMEASDRCLVDIERFDLEPERAILHGIIDENDIENVSSLKTFEEKLALMSKIVDINNISERMKVSLPEIGKNIRTWPQLASDVTYGGGIVAGICRQILLGENICSSRIYFDPLESLS